MMEKNELNDENSAIQTHIEKLKGEIEARLVRYKPEFHVAPPSAELESPEQVTNFPGDMVQLPTIDPRLQEGPAVLVVPLGGQLQAAFSATNAGELRLKPCSNISKPHARYPTPADSWTSQLLGEQINST